MNLGLIFVALTSTNPQMVGVGTMSTKYETISATVAADGTAVFARSCPGTLRTKTVLCTVNLNERGAMPSVLPFSGTDSDLAPQFSPDGKKLYFISRRNKSRFFTAWSVTRVGKSWGQPVEMPAPINSGSHQLSISESGSGTFAVLSFSAAGTTVSLIRNGKVEPIDVISKTGFVNDLCISKDERFIVFSSSGAADELLTEGAIYNRGDLYVSEKKGGVWQKPRHLDPPVNTRAGESAPSFSPDGKYLYFCSDRGFLSTHIVKPVTYKQLQLELQTTHNCLGKIFRVPISQIIGK